jgi:NADH-quinone oxidoreductase subunit L
MIGIHAPNHFEEFLEPAIATVRPEHAPEHAVKPRGADATPAAAESSNEISSERLFTLVSTIVALLGIGIGWGLFTRRPVRAMPSLLENKYYVDEIYDSAIISPIEQSSRGFLWKIVDVRIIDGFVNGVPRVFAALAGVLRHTQTGFARGYAAVILIGAIVVIGYFATR